MLKARNSFVNYKNQQELWNWIKNSHQMGFSLGTRALSLLQFTVCPNMQMSLWVFYAARFGSRFVVGSGSSSSSSGSPGPVNAQRSERFLVKQSVRTSPTFGICIWFSFPRFSLFSCFALVLGPTKGQHMTQIGQHVLQIRHPNVSQIHFVPALWHSSQLCQFLTPAGSTLQLQLEALFHYEHAHSGTRKYAHTSPYLFICEWTNTRQKCVWNF